MDSSLFIAPILTEVIVDGIYIFNSKYDFTIEATLDGMDSTATEKYNLTYMIPLMSSLYPISSTELGHPFGIDLEGRGSCVDTLPVSNENIETIMLNEAEGNTTIDRTGVKNNIIFPIAHPLRFEESLVISVKLYAYGQVGMLMTSNLYQNMYYYIVQD